MKRSASACLRKDPPTVQQKTEKVPPIAVGPSFLILSRPTGQTLDVFAAEISEVVAQITQGHEAEADSASPCESPHDITTETASFPQHVFPQWQDKGLGPRSFSAPNVCDSSFYQTILLLSNQTIHLISSFSCLPGLNYCSPQASEQTGICRTTHVPEGSG